jgi:FtsP/CotA-like multicopper oxidase with cupredoxin domain
MAQQYIGTARWNGTTKQTVAYTGTAGTATNAVSPGVYKVRLISTTDAYVLAVDGPAFTAVTSATGGYLPALTVEYVTVTPGQKLSAVMVSSGGNLEIMECV